MPRKFSKRYVVEDRTGGVLRFYLRRKGQPKVRLPGLPGSDEFNAAYYQALNGMMTATKSFPKLSTKGSLRWLAMALMLYTCQRRSDAVLFGR